jgi:NADP-dependent alcohol dehydrogenase
MKNFDFYNPVKILFGKDKIAEVGQHIPLNSKILITYGGGSIKRNGVYDQVVNALKGHTFREFGGIEPNPAYETLMKAVEIVKKENINFLLAVGGGSVIDGTKFIACAAKYEGEEPWDICSKQVPVKDAVPLATVLTLPATGSEMNMNAVVTRKSTKEKLAFYSPFSMPKFSVLDPETSYSLPKHQIANGVVDAFVHILEQYLTYPVNSPIQDYFAEGILKTLICEGRKAYNLETPDYENRANFMWGATMALNGLIACGVITDWSTHKIGHELTALHGLDHAVTLAIVLPGVLNEVRDLRKVKLLQYARNVWNINNEDEKEAINQAIEKTEQFFNSLGIKSRLSDFEIGKDSIEFIVSRFKEIGSKYIGFSGDITTDNLEEILISRL